MFVTDNLRTGSIMRPRVAGTVARGESEFNAAVGLEVPSENSMRMPFFGDQRQKLVNEKNPVPTTKASINNGKRQFSVNCGPCHGSYTDEGHQIGAYQEASKFPVPNLADQVYAERTDGHIFGYIYFGGAIMPRYGWKLSKNEIWDIVNYVRNLQKEGK